MDSIENNVWTCLHKFGILCDTLDSHAGSPSDGSPQRSGLDNLTLPKIKAELTRFKVWSANIGAHSKGRSSLDYRLRDASNIRNQVVKLLQNLAESLADAREILTGDDTPWDKEPLSPDTVKDGSDDDYAMEPFSLASSELLQIYSSIVEDINCLLRLYVSIRNPAPHDRFKKSSLTDTSHFEPFDVQHVRARFSTAPDRLTERLGKAISRRRQYFKYRKMHRQRMASKLDTDCEADDNMQSTTASSIPNHFNQATIETLNSWDEDDTSDASRSQTSYATSVTNSEGPKIPARPQGAEDGPFECPFCFMIISTPSNHLWKKHVFTDLRPYICMSLDCPAPDQDFQRRSQWAEHVQKYHWKIWTCSLGCNQTFTTLAGIRHHLDKAHAAAYKSAHLESLLTFCEQPKATNDPTQCPLCDELLPTFKHYKQHVGRHQEHLALFALPQLEEEEKYEEDLDRVRRLLESFHTLVEEAVIISVANDHDLKKESEYEAAQTILKGLAKDVAAEEAASFSPSDIAEDAEETTDGLSMAETGNRRDEGSEHTDMQVTFSSTRPPSATTARNVTRPHHSSSFFPTLSLPIQTMKTQMYHPNQSPPSSHSSETDPSGPIQDDHRAGEEQFYSELAPSIRSRNTARKDQPGGEAHGYHSSRRSVMYHSDSRHSSDTIHYGDGHMYALSGELKFGLDHPQPSRLRREGGFGRGHYRPNVIISADHGETQPAYFHENKITPRNFGTRTELTNDYDHGREPQHLREHKKRSSAFNPNDASDLEQIKEQLVALKMADMEKETDMDNPIAIQTKMARLFSLIKQTKSTNKSKSIKAPTTPPGSMPIKGSKSPLGFNPATESGFQSEFRTTPEFDSTTQVLRERRRHEEDNQERERYQDGDDDRDDDRLKHRASPSL